MVNVALGIIFIALILLCIAATFLTSQQKRRYGSAWCAGLRAKPAARLRPQAGVARWSCAPRRFTG